MVSGDSCTGVGVDAGFGAASSAQTANSFFGASAGRVVSTGSRNTSIGTTSLKDLTTGNFNTVVGYDAGKGITTGSANTIIGAQVTGLSSSLANTIIIADGVGNKRFYANASGAHSFDGGSTFGSAGNVLISNGNAAVPSWTAQFALTNGSGTTANSTAVDLGGTMSADADIDGLATYDVKFHRANVAINADGHAPDSILDVEGGVRLIGKTWATQGGIQEDTFCVDLNTGQPDYQMVYPGIYQILSTPDPAVILKFPNPALWVGHTISILNRSTFATLGGSYIPENALSSPFTKIQEGYSYIFKAVQGGCGGGGDYNWVCFSRYDGTVD
jgi:hypothetical protein